MTSELGEMITTEIKVNAHGCRSSRPEFARNGEISENEIATCLAWIERHARKSEKIERRFTSYELKHYVEDWTASRDRDGVRIVARFALSEWLGKEVYVPNGAFIVAALRSDYRVQRVAPLSPNAYFDMAFAIKRSR